MAVVTLAILVNPSLWSAAVLTLSRARRDRRLVQLIGGQGSIDRALAAQFRYLRLRRRVQGNWLGGSLLLEGELVQLTGRTRRVAWQRNDVDGARGEAQFRARHALWQRELRTGEFLVAALSPGVIGADKGDEALKAFVADCHHLTTTAQEMLGAAYRDGPGFLTTHSLMESITLAECLPESQWMALDRALQLVSADWRLLGWLGARVFETLLLAACLQETHELDATVAQVRELSLRAGRELSSVQERTAERDTAMYRIREELLSLQRGLLSGRNLGWTGAR